MKFSNIYMIYPVNRALERAIASSLGLLSEELVASATPDRKVTAADNFLYTRGNFEQHDFSSKIYEGLIEVLEASLADASVNRARAPLAWAETQNKLGNVLAALGQQRRDADLFERAIQCFNSALEVLSQEDSPLEWAATQYNLGTANQALGRLLETTKPLKDAVDAYTNALLVWSKDEFPEDWMYTMHQLGATFHTFGKPPIPEIRGCL